jgi:S-formylglutathione hydrolase
MGGHGALTLALRHPSAFKSVSAFAPICNPAQVAWGQKAFAGYLGSADQEAWKQHDATELVRAYAGPRLPVLMDTGTDDEFLKDQLHPWAFEAAAAGKLDLQSNMRVGYDHSYFFIATFVEDHVEWHAEHLGGGP